MPIFITQGNYTQAAIKGMLAKPEDRMREVDKLFAKAGGKLHALYLTFGEFDFLLIGEARNEKVAASVLLAAAGGGGVTNLRTTVAMTSAQAKGAFAAAGKLAASFRSAGGAK